MFRLAYQKTLHRFPFSRAQVIVAIIVTAVASVALYVYDSTRVVTYLIPATVLLFTYIALFVVPLIWNLVARWIWVGFFEFSIYGEGIVKSDDGNYALLKVNNTDNTVFTCCYAKFIRIQNVREAKPLDLLGVGKISWAGKRNPGKEFEYQTISGRTTQELYIARIEADNGVCEALGKSLKPRRFKGRLNTKQTSSGTQTTFTKR